MISHTNSTCDSLPDLTSTNKSDCFFHILIPFESTIMVGAIRSLCPLRGTSGPACAQLIQVFEHPFGLVYERHIRHVIYAVECVFGI